MTRPKKTKPRKTKALKRTRKKPGKPPRNAFKQGNLTGQLGGRPQETEEFKTLKAACKEWQQKTFAAVMAMHPGDLRVLIKDLEADIEAVFAKGRQPKIDIDMMAFAALKCAWQATWGGSDKHLDLILNRLVGKPLTS